MRSYPHLGHFMWCVPRSVSAALFWTTARCWRNSSASRLAKYSSSFLLWVIDQPVRRMVAAPAVAASPVSFHHPDLRTAPYRAAMTTHPNTDGHPSEESRRSHDHLSA